MWVAYFVFALASPWGWATVFCPALMLYFLFRVTGIPATEEQALKSRGDDYREYQRTTSAFFPWFPRAATRGRPGSVQRAAAAGGALEGVELEDLEQPRARASSVSQPRSESFSTGGEVEPLARGR